MSLITALKRLFGFGPKSNAGDRSLTCIDCNKPFVFDVGEQQFFKSKGFSDPKRCPDCRKKIKSQMKRKRRGGGSNGGGGGRPPRRRGFGRHRHDDSLIDGDSPYADVR